MRKAVIILSTLALIASGCKQAAKNQIIMTLTPNGEASVALIGSGSATIDWGDGSPVETHELKSNEGQDNDDYTDMIYRHTYSITSACTITVTGGNIRHLITFGLTGLDVSRNAQLTVLDCSFNQLTDLDLSNNTQLRWVDCRGNRLSSAALDALFSSLHNNDNPKTIAIMDNPGIGDCKMKIAVNKGWEIIYDGGEVTEEFISVETRAKNPNDLVRSDETIFEKIFGDLNNDGEEDCVIITKQTKNGAFVSIEEQSELDRNRRGILVAFKDGEYYNTILAIPDCFSSENEDGGVYFAPELSVEILKGNLKIRYEHGRYGWWQYIFRHRNNNFELIGYDINECRGPIIEKAVSINFLTKKRQTKVNVNENANPNEGIKEIFEETWQDIVVNKLVNLTDIEDFDEFNVSGSYVEK